MTAIPQQSMHFLRSSAPFNAIDSQDLIEVARQIKVAYITPENSREILEQQQGSVFLISSGQFSVKDSDGPQRHLSEGDYFGTRNALKGRNFPIELDVDSSGLVYCLPNLAFEHCVQTYPAVEKFFQAYDDGQQMQSDAVTDSHSMWLYRPVSEVIGRSPICTDIDASIQQSAKVMAKHAVSSLLITDKKRLVGIITDRDLRNRVLADGRDTGAAISNIMTTEPIKVTHQRTLFEALCLMTEHNIHHLPVVHKETQLPMGMLTATDMVRLQRGNLLFIADELAKAPSLYELTRLSWQVPHYLAKHAKRLGDFDIAGKVLAQVTDIITRRLITFFQQQQGLPPFDYCWLVFGSQARQDQTMGSDQDNALLLEQSPNESETEYFANMSEYVCQGLAKCGIKLCNGNIMASNPDLRLSVEQAISEAQSWVTEPTPNAIMHFNIFLDVRPVAGNAGLYESLHLARKGMLKQPIFLAALARHANQARVPLSMFQKFVFEKGQNAEDCINLKNNAVVIINNLVRIHALEHGIPAPATLDRLQALSDGKAMQVSDANNLRDIWLFLNRLRWRHQISHNVTDNLVSISDLSSIEKHQLKAAFQTISRAQQSAILQYAGGMA